MILHWGVRLWRFIPFWKAEIPRKPWDRWKSSLELFLYQVSMLWKNYSSTKDCGSLVIFSSLSWGSGESTPIKKIFTSRSMGNENTQHRLCSAQYFSVSNLISAMRFIQWRSCTMLYFTFKSWLAAAYPWPVLPLYPN